MSRYMATAAAAVPTPWFTAPMIPTRWRIRLRFELQENVLLNAQTLKTMVEQGGILGLNIGKNATTPIDNAVDDYLACLNGVYPWADYVTVNISSPNTPGLRDLQHGAALDELLAACTEARGSTPLFLKVAPDLDAAAIDGDDHTDDRIGEVGSVLAAAT